MIASELIRSGDSLRKEIVENGGIPQYVLVAICLAEHIYFRLVY